MSRFRSKEKQPAARDIPPLPAPGLTGAAPQMVPMSAEHFARRRRNRNLLWLGGIVLLAALILIIWYRSSSSAGAQKSLEEASRLFETGKYPEALTAANRAAGDRVIRPEAYRLRIAIFKALDRPKDALADISRLIELEPGPSGHYRTRAQLYLDTGNLQGAIQDYTTLIERDGESSAFTGRGICYDKLGQLDKAVADFTRSIEREPTVENHLRRGLAYVRLGDYRKAIADYDRAIEISPRMSHTYRSRATAREALGDTAGALLDRAKATELETPVREKPDDIKPAGTKPDNKR